MGPQPTPTAKRGQTYKFPQDPVLVRLLSSPHHQTKSSEPIIHDARGFRKSYPELLSDILQTAHLVRTASPRSMLDERGLLRDSSPYIGVLAGGYEFLVAFFAIRVMGGACMPIASGILPEEAYYLVSKSKATCLLAGKSCRAKAAKIRSFAEAQGDSLSLLSISTDEKPKDHNTSIEIDKKLQRDPSGPGILLFTSGTTSRPNGVVLPRRCFASPDGVETSDGIAVSHRACNWIAGVNSLVRPILTGKRLHVLGENAGAEGLLTALMRHRFTHVAFTPTLLREMKELILSRGGLLEQYATGFQGLPSLKCSAAHIEPSLREFWTRLTGLPFENIYSLTETGGLVSRAVSRPNRSIGTPPPGYEVKLSDADRGEILVKTPALFIQYLDDEEKTKAAFDQDGFSKTSFQRIAVDRAETLAGILRPRASTRPHLPLTSSRD
ncbi:hypothetical protein C8A01DRAFT_21138 [Parachaetomium inaequale]|uniref:AMP-dependent synthetase/ligase domain-containing protein n=1 Tax=Parachaetomium inaequale TaxID=2588326 RepID=A0AAN6P4Y5_9PEZI|nr:hypothetical protein C8A01DRAFT_21138 [Parachaetomium inaequale]